MKKNRLIFLSFCLLTTLTLVAAGLLRSPKAAPGKQDCSCQESLDDIRPAGRDGLGWENLSSQFFSSF
ncbi:MAG TPA: hypothetical protein PKC69_15420 [Chitinophagaceae bacterium]|nr:hypothetical protein [Chitinophagaceae bacterium]